MAESIEKEFGIKSELIESDGGVFEVAVDGKLIFSKKSLGRFPEHSEILESIRTLKK